MDRVYRIGQKRDVVVYRLITCGTVEEKMYRKQVFKQGLMLTAMEESAPYRYFTKQELHEMFALEDPARSVTQQQLAALHGGRRVASPEVAAHLRDFVCRAPGVFGISDHDLLFSCRNAPSDPAALAAVQALAQQAAQHAVAQLDADDVPATITAPGALEPTGRTPLRRPLSKRTRTRTPAEPPLPPPSTHCCEQHRAAAAPLYVERCRCFTCDEDLKIYNNLLARFLFVVPSRTVFCLYDDVVVMGKNRDCNESGMLEDALETGLQMLSICDEDPVLQFHVYELGRELGFTEH